MSEIIPPGMIPLDMVPPASRPAEMSPAARQDAGPDFDILGLMGDDGLSVGASGEPDSASPDPVRPDAPGSASGSAPGSPLGFGDLALSRIQGHPEFFLVRDGNARPHHFLSAMMEQDRLAEMGTRRPVRAILAERRFLRQQTGGTGRQRDADENRLNVLIPESSLRPHGIILLRLDDGVLRYASRTRPADDVLSAIIGVSRQVGFDVDRMERELLSNREIYQRMAALSRKSDGGFLGVIAEMRAQGGAYSGHQVMRLRDAMITAAISARASDIDLSVMDEGYASCRFRIDGDYLQVAYSRAEDIKPLMGVLKIEAGIDDGHSLSPQDGRFGYVHQDRRIDFRVAHAPKHQGESMAIRIQDPSSMRSLSDLMVYGGPFVDAVMPVLTSSLKQGGAIIITGPMGQGKSTAMAAMIMEIDRERRKVLTIDQPTEIPIYGVEHWEVGEAGQGRDYASLVRASMRHDLDIIGIGELRDQETVVEYCRILESGHLAMSTTHSHSCLEGWRRIVNFIPERYREEGLRLVSDKMLALINLRLVRRVCPSCRIRRPLTEKEIHTDILPPGLNDVSSAHPDGCRHCYGTGYLGRVNIPEILVPPNDVQTRQTILREMEKDISHAVKLLGAGLHSRRTAAMRALCDGVIDMPTYTSIMEMSET